MPQWYETYADEVILARALELGRRAVVVFALVSGALVAAAPVASLLLPGRLGLFVAVACALLLVAHAVWLMIRLGKLHATIWCIRLSARQLVANDGGRRRKVLPWIGVIRVDLGEEALTVDGLLSDGRSATISVPTDFADHDALARRIAEYAVAHRCVICVDGEPLQNVSLDGALAVPPQATGLADDEPTHGER